MKNIIFTILFLTSSTIFAAGSFVAGYTVDNYKGVKLDKIVIRYDDLSFSLEQHVEKLIIEKLDNYAKTTSYIDTIPPYSDLNDKEILKKLLEANNTYYINIHKVRDNTHTSVNKNEFFSVNKVYSIVDVVYKIEIFDLTNKNSLVWVGDVYIFGSSSLIDSLKHLRNRLIEQLREDDLLK